MPTWQTYHRRTLEELLSSLESFPKAAGREWTEQEFRDEFFGLRNQFKWAASTPNRRFIAPRQSLERTFEQLLIEDDPGRRFCLLGAFANLPMPRFEPSILKLMDSPIRELRWAVAEAFSHMSVPEARVKGRELLEGMPKLEGWEYGFELLTGSGRAEDLPLIIATLDAMPTRTMDAFDVHKIVWAVRPLPKIGKPTDSAPIMHWIYENSPCANCRNESVFWLVENRLASDELLEECLDDCDERVGDLALESLK